MKKVLVSLVAGMMVFYLSYDFAFATEENMQKEEKLSLYSKSAVLIDGDSGRVLYAKDADAILPMASTTKIMTCILALEYEGVEEWVTFSNYASAQPKVHLGARAGKQFLLKDLLYSLMLESHNDTAVAIAEHIGGKLLIKDGKVSEGDNIDSKQAVERFAERMNEKAKELGLKDTFFITPNGLDANKEVQEDGGIVLLKHGTTATELAILMRYCAFQSPKKEDFLQITRQKAYSFWDKEGKVQYFCNNHNALLEQMPQALTGKTGFTNAAGYCYVAAFTEGEEKYCVALLACGWPNNKNYKWADSRELFTYGAENYAYKTFMPKVQLHEIMVKNGADESGNPYERAKVGVIAQNGEDIERTFSLLVRENEEVLARVNQHLILDAPIEKEEVVGEVEYYLQNEDGTTTVLEKILLFSEKCVAEIDFHFVFEYVFNRFLILGKK